jgi:hypothetical protein
MISYNYVHAGGGGRPPPPPPPPHSRKLLKGISNIYINFLNITQSLNMIGVLGRLNNLCKPPPLGHTQKTLKNISIPQDKYYYNAIEN